LEINSFGLMQAGHRIVRYLMERFFTVQKGLRKDRQMGMAGERPYEPGAGR